jgi:hypothetical protein
LPFASLQVRTDARFMGGDFSSIVHRKGAVKALRGAVNSVMTIQ